MTKFRTQKNSFLGGEFSPTALGRMDAPQYKHACKKLFNMIPMLSGGAYRRPGFLFEAATEKASSFTQGAVASPWSAKLIPYEHSTGLKFMLGITYSEVDSDISLVMHPSVGVQRATWGNQNYLNFGADSYTRDLGPKPAGTADTLAYLDKGVCTYDEWHDVNHVQIGDIMWFVHENREPTRFQYTNIRAYGGSSQAYGLGAHFASGITGTRTAAQNRDARPYLPQNTTATTLALSGTAGSVTVTASAAVFDEGHVGAYFKFVSGGATVGCFEITAVASATSATATVIVSPNAGTAAATWWEQAWSHSLGWPRIVGVFQNRIFYASTRSYPDSIWFSQAFDYDQLSVSDETSPESGPTGDEPFTLTLGEALVKEILWINAPSNAQRTITVGLAADEWTISEVNGSFGADSVSAERKSAWGSVSRRTAFTGSELIFHSKSGLRALVYDDVLKSYSAEPIQVLFDEIPNAEAIGYATGDYPTNAADGQAASLRREIRQMVWDQSRNTLWVLDTTGNLYGCTRDRQLGVTAWHSHQHGSYDADDVQTPASDVFQPDYASPRGFISSIAVLPNVGTKGTDLWICAKAGHIAAGWVFTIERMIGKAYPYSSAYTFPSSADYGAGLYFADSCVYDQDSAGDGTLIGKGADGYSSKGFAHLEGDSVVGTALCARGLMPLPAVTVASGVVEMASTLPGFSGGDDYGFAYGLSFNSYLIPVRPDEGSVIGTAQGAIKRIHEAMVRFYRTTAAVVGRDADNVEEIPFRTSTTPMSSAPELFTGDKRVKLNTSDDYDGYIYIGQHKPLPQCVVSVAMSGVLYD